MTDGGSSWQAVATDGDLQKGEAPKIELLRDDLNCQEWFYGSRTPTQSWPTPWIWQPGVTTHQDELDDLHSDKEGDGDRVREQDPADQQNQITQSLECPPVNITLYSSILPAQGLH